MLQFELVWLQKAFLFCETNVLIRRFYIAGISAGKNTLEE